MQTFKNIQENKNQFSNFFFPFFRFFFSFFLSLFLSFFFFLIITEGTDLKAEIHVSSYKL